MRPLICITTDSTQRQAPTEPRQLILPKTYAEAIAAAGGLPVLAAECCSQQLANLCQGLLLSGGDDVQPTLYGQTPLTESLHPDPERDRFEFSLTQAFLAQEKPIFGICRGCQVLNCVLGGTLYQDLPEQLGVNHLDSNLRHPITCTEDSVLTRLFSRRFRVNSTHHQAIRDIAPGLKITALSIDGGVEAFEGIYPSQLLWGVQFHPERLTGAQWDGRTPDFAPLFRLFVDAARTN
jgi:putative glutamine amidotransferase